MRSNLLKHNNLMLRSEQRERLEAWAASDHRSLIVSTRFGRDGRRECYTTNAIAGGFQVPLPGGRIDGASVFGQYNRMTR